MTDSVVAEVPPGLFAVLESTVWAFAFGGRVRRVKEALLTPGGSFRRKERVDRNAV